MRSTGPPATPTATATPLQQQQAPTGPRPRSDADDDLGQLTGSIFAELTRLEGAVQQWRVPDIVASTTATVRTMPQLLHLVDAMQAVPTLVSRRQVCPNRVNYADHC